MVNNKKKLRQLIDGIMLETDMDSGKAKCRDIRSLAKKISESERKERVGL